MTSPIIRARFKAAGFAIIISVVLMLGLHGLLSAAARGIQLRPPYDGTYRLNTFFDHHFPDYGNDNGMTIYTGESVPDCSPYCYQGHSGYDWSMYTGTQILAAADGVVVGRAALGTGYGWRVILDHGNGYQTLYGHLSALNVVLNQHVATGDVIGLSGSTGRSTGPHLHFGIYYGPVPANSEPDEDHATDPFGWRGQHPDPLVNYPAQGQGHTASCLWRSLDTDPISCFDTIAEDAGRSSSIVGTWNDSTVGNGYHAYYRDNISSNLDIWATWLVTDIVPGTNKVYAFIPSQNATTHRATYWIYATSSTRWQSCTIEQAPYNDEWVSLGTYQLPNYGYMFLYANTQEVTNTTYIAADAIKFRSYPQFLPLILQDDIDCGFDCL